MKNKTPLVSILCITYNQEKYIAEALDGFLIQKTDFPFEIIVHDDASKDRTQEIVKQYASDNPGIFKLFFEETNQYSKDNTSFINRMYEQAQGEYIAVCEGDDYWTDPNKLQLQVDYLESHSDYAVVFHPVKVFYENDRGKYTIYPEQTNSSTFTLEELLKRNYIQSNSIMYRKQKYDALAENVMPMDWYTHLYHAQFGKIGFINKIMSAYRRHPDGVWWDSSHNLDKIWLKYGLSHLALFDAVFDIYGKNTTYREIINQNSAKVFKSLVKVDRKYKKDLVKQAIDLFPESANVFVVSQVKEMEMEQKNTQDVLMSKDKEISNLGEQISSYQLLVKSKQAEINDIKNSRIWKLRNIVVRTLGRKP